MKVKTVVLFQVEIILTVEISILWLEKKALVVPLELVSLVLLKPELDKINALP